MRLNINKYWIAVLLLICLFLAVVVSINYISRKNCFSKTDSDAEKMHRLFNQPQWSNINFREGITGWSMRPFLAGDDKSKIQLAKAASM